MLRITGFRAELGESDEEIFLRVRKVLREKSIENIKIVRRAIDARRKNDVHYVLSIDADVKNETAVLNKNIRGVSAAPDVSYCFPESEPLKKRPVIAGSGPAGLFCALFLARGGHRPIVIERGADVDARTKMVSEFWKQGKLNPESNVQFGEGGAGTFSDGKLTTGIKDRRINAVLGEFVRFGASEDILVNAKPHIGTDILRNVVRNIRCEIIRLGGEVRFNTRLTDIDIENGSVKAAVVVGGRGEERIETDDIILAIGHSSRDTVEMLYNRGVEMERKPFSVGVRIEHSQSFISDALYGKAASKLAPADYKMAVHLPNGRSVYTFCMCPGGYVVAAASEPNTVVTNGMSYSARDGANANSALLVGVLPEDFGGSDALAGIRFQQKIERRAFEVSGSYSAPAQRVEDFLLGHVSSDFGAICPTYAPGVAEARIDDVLPEFVCDSLRAGILMMDKKIHGFAKDAVLTAPETRSSSPVRFLRDSGMELSVGGLYSAGEGGGHAGGITSSAVDGIRVAEAVVMKARG